MQDISPLISQVVVSGTAATILASAVTHYILEESLTSRKGVVQSLLVGGNVFGAMLLEKGWQRLTFGALSAGTVFVLLFQKRRLSL